MKKLITILLILFTISIFSGVTANKDSLLLNESFEGDFPPANWILNTTGAGFVKAYVEAGALVYTGSSSLCHWDNEGAQDDWIWSPAVSIPAENSCILSFWQNGSWLTYYDFHEIVISTDCGLTYDQLYNGAPPSIPDDPDAGMWEKIALSLKSYAGETVQIGFHYKGDLSDQWFIDDVTVMYDCDAPVITDISANESLYPDLYEYFNNDMLLKLSLEDYCGAADVTGHYSFDGGTTVHDVVFEKSKVSEIWTGIVPARSDETAGFINFTLTDIGNIVGTSSNYTIKFVPDTDPPVVKSFYWGEPVFINEEMTLRLTFTDESAISNCAGFFSKTGWSDSTEVTMIPSKIHLYTYTGTIPEETDVTSGQVKFAVADFTGNNIITNVYDVEWIDGQVGIFDDFDGNHDPANWIFPEGSTWGYSTENAYSPVTALSDSPGGNYADSKTNIVETKIMNLSSVVGATISFWAKVDLEYNYDYCYLEGTFDNGISWVKLAEFNGNALPWKYYSVGAGIFAGYSGVKFRFRTITDFAGNQDGVYFDDIKINTYNFHQDDNPIIIHEGPEFYGGVLSEHKSYADVYDFDGVDSVWVEYFVDYSDSYLTISATYTGSNRWEFTIPAYEAGTRIDYLIRARDASEDHFESSIGGFAYIIGYHLNYTNGLEFIDYADDITPLLSSTADNAVAVRLSMGPMDKPDTDTYKADLIGFTIANYMHEYYSCDPLYAHVWISDNGKPGKDLIDPIYMEPGSTLDDPYALTYVDLRPYSEIFSNIEGDVFVGFTTAGTRTFVFLEGVANHSAVPGYIDFNRTWLGQFVGEGIDWTFDDLDNYCITGLTGAYTWVGIEDDNLPVVTELKQNYPNPFNPVTTIRFDLAKDSKVSLTIYDVMGREVAKPVDKEMNRGSHNVTFNASKLVSGVYYYTFKAGNVNKTRKMMLMK